MNGLRKITHTHTHTHTEEYYSALKKEGILTSVTWMDLEDIMLSEINQKKKAKYYTISLLCEV